MNQRSKLFVVSLSAVMVGALLLGTLVGKAQAGPDEKYKYLTVFTEVLSRIKGEYVSEPDIKNVTLGAMNGMLESLDPYASYLSADQYKQYLRTKETRKSDVGLVIAKRYGYVMVVDAIEGSPAAKANLSTNDIVETINGVSTRDMPLAYAELLLAGDVGTQVELTVLRPGRGTEAQTMKLTRAVVAKPAIASKMLEGEVAYVKASTLEYGKVKQIATAINELKSKGAKKLVLDLRNNAIGDPSDGVQLANLFLNKGLITYAKGQKVEQLNYEAKPESAIWNLPLVVIVNAGTAAGAEIATSALLENKRAEVVGIKTYGNAAERAAIRLDDGSAVILATAKYYGPVSNKAIQDTGVVPSVPEAENAAGSVGGDDEEDATNPSANPRTPSSATAPPAQKSEDPLLKKALEVLEKGAPAVLKEAESANVR